MCCGVGTGGLINASGGSPSAVPVSENFAYCNKDPATDGNPPSLSYTGELIGADTAGPNTKMSFTFKPEDFKCFDGVPPPIPVYPLTG
jgi:hypothetical protein